MTKRRRKSRRHQEGERGGFLSTLPQRPFNRCFFLLTFLCVFPAIWMPGVGYSGSCDRKKDWIAKLWLSDSREPAGQSWADHWLFAISGHISSLTDDTKKIISSRFTINGKSFSNYWYARIACTFLASGCNRVESSVRSSVDYLKA